ncbi:hypothetical protein Tco_0465068 [Tanacetum coccineum]
MVAYLVNSEGSEGFHQIIDFLTASHIKNALTECPTLYAYHIKQFWQTVALSTNEDGDKGITATIDRKVKLQLLQMQLEEEEVLKMFKLTSKEEENTAGVKAKDKGNAIMHESEPPKKIKKRVQVQMSVNEELAKKVFEEEQARFNAEQEARFKAEQEQERIDFKIALELQKQLDERE